MNSKAPDLPVLFYRYDARLQDLQVMQHDSVRLEGGLSSRIQLASLNVARIEEAILLLVTDNPDAAEEIHSMIRHSRQPGVAGFARLLGEKLK